MSIHWSIRREDEDVVLSEELTFLDSGMAKLAATGSTPFREAAVVMTSTCQVPQDTRWWCPC
jgi:hypothetical protein